MDGKPVTISMTRFADFVVSDSIGQFTKVKEVRRQYEQPYTPSGDFWSRWREGVEDVHRRHATRDELAKVGESALHNRAEQYESACAGYAKFWGRKHLEVVGTPKPVLWTHGRLQVRVNPEWIMRVNRTETVVKLHLKEKLQLNQRLANPLLHLLHMNFGSGGRSVALLDVHRGKLWTKATFDDGLVTVLQMQAATFIAGWEALEARPKAA